jgi:hypothetical protein
MTDRQRQIIGGIHRVMYQESCKMDELFDVLASYTIDNAMETESQKNSKLYQRIASRLDECKLLAAEIKK